MARQILQPQALTRRRPTQSRAQAKLDLIFEATIRILDEHGLQALTTNRIAEIAGISVGTLYQYFSGKNDIVAALAQREMNDTLSSLQATLAKDASVTREERIRCVVRALLGAFGGRHRARKIVLDMLLTGSKSGGADAATRQVVTMLASRGRLVTGDKPIRLDPMQAFVLVQSVAGVIRAALTHDAQWLSNPAFEQNLFCLIRGYLDTLTVLDIHGSSTVLSSSYGSVAIAR